MKSKIRLIAVFMVMFIVVLSSVDGYIYASADSAAKEKQAKELNVFEMKITSTDKDLKISKTYEIQDFNGNIYTVIECTPIGYYIFHNESGNFVEYSETSKSPYYGKSGDLYYAGPTYYYQFNDNKYKHTLLEGDQIRCNETTDIKKKCENMSANLLESSNSDIIQYIDSTEKNSISDEDLKSEIETYMVASSNYNYIPNYEYIQQLDTAAELGYLSGGYCGYIAANVILYYWQMRQPSGNFIPYSTWYNNDGMLDHTLTDYLIDIGEDQFGYGADSYPWTISNVLDYYCRAEGVDASVSYRLLGVVGISSELQKDRPTIVFGDFVSPNDGSFVAHAVIAYGYGTGNFVTNFGWAGYSNVVISGVVGGNTRFIPD